MIEPIEISSYKELVTRAQGLEPSSQNAMLCYRGQVRHYKHIVPSMVRHVASADFNLEETVYLWRFWTSVAEKIAEEHFTHGSWGPQITHAARMVIAEGILQHYGFRSYFVDVSLDLDIALCFSHYEYHDRFPLLDGVGSRSKMRRVAWYAPSLEDRGYVYVLDCPRWHPRQGRPRHGELIDLTSLVRPGWNRVQMQRAMLVHSDPRKPNNGDLSDYVRAIFKVPLPLPGCDEALEESRTWFPGPGDDPIYKTLLASRFVEHTYIADRPIQFWRRVTTANDCAFLNVQIPPNRKLKILRRTLDFPEYHDDPGDVNEIKYLRSFDKILKPTFFFEWLRRVVGSSRLKRKPLRASEMAALKKVIRGTAIFVLAPFAELQQLRESDGFTRYKPTPPKLNLFFEFSFYNYSGPFADVRALRGVWIGGTSKRLEVAVLGNAGGRPWISPVAAFLWREWLSNDRAAAARPAALSSPCAQAPVRHRQETGRGVADAWRGRLSSNALFARITA